MSGGQVVVTSNAEIAESADIIIRCPDATESTKIYWSVYRSGPNLAICARYPIAIDCETNVPTAQSAQYAGRVTRDTSGGVGSELYSIRVSKVLLNESGTYLCQQFGDDKNVKANVRIIGKNQLYFVLWMHLLQGFFFLF